MDTSFTTNAQGERARFIERLRKKKDEFPDAFSLLAVESQLADREECYVVSEDGDLRAFCEENGRFILVEDLSKLLDTYNSHDRERSEFIKEYIAVHKLGIKEAIKAQVNEAEFYNSSTWEDSEVISHRVLDIDDYDPDIIQTDDESCLVTFDAKVHYQVHVEGPDLINGLYDRESGRMVTFERTVREENQEFEVKVELEINFGVKGGEFDVSDMKIEAIGLTSGVEVSVEEEERNSWF